MSKQKVWTETDGLWGLCPHCHKVDGSLNIGRGHWMYCDAHKTRWWIGSGLFTVLENEDEQRKHYEQKGFGQYQDAEPFFPENLPW